MDDKTASTRFKMEMAKRMFNSTPKAVSKSNLSGLYKSMSNSTKSVGSSTAKNFAPKPALKLVSSSEKRVNSRLNNLKRKFIDAKVSAGMPKKKARSLATEFDDAADLESALGMANPSKVKAAPTFGGLTGGAVEFKKAASIDENFIAGFEKIAINTGTIMRAANNSLRRQGIHLNDPMLAAAEKGTTKFLDLPKNARKLLLDRIKIIKRARQ